MGETDADRSAPSLPARLARRAGQAAVAAAVAGMMLVGASGVAAARFTSTPAASAMAVSAAPFFTCAAAATASSPSGYWRLNESAGPTAADSSGHGDTGTYQGGVTYGVAGPCKRDKATAVTLNGSSGYVSTATQVSNPQVFTVEIWFKTTTTAGGRLIGFGSSKTGQSNNDDRHVYMTNGGQVIFGVQPKKTATITSTDSYNDGTWHLVDASLSSAGMALYLDGQLVASDPKTTSAESYSGYWRLGSDSISSWASAPTSSYFAGSVAQAAVYPTALSATQIANDYTAGAG